MSPTRVFVGLLVAGLFLTGELAAFWFFGFPPKWVPIALFAFVVLIGGTLIELQTQKALRRYWDRACMGIRWRRRFPESPKTEIREFLDLFVGAFGFRRTRRCFFSPDDKVMEVYRTLYPPGNEVDGMELETLCKKLNKRYGIDFATSWREDITLGEIYEQARQRMA